MRTLKWKINDPVPPARKIFLAIITKHLSCISSSRVYSRIPDFKLQRIHWLKMHRAAFLHSTSIWPDDKFRVGRLWSVHPRCHCHKVVFQLHMSNVQGLRSVTSFNIIELGYRVASKLESASVLYVRVLFLKGGSEEGGVGAACCAQTDWDATVTSDFNQVKNNSIKRLNVLIPFSNLIFVRNSTDTKCYWFFILRFLPYNEFVYKFHYFFESWRNLTSRKYTEFIWIEVFVTSF